jgi:hypothetical protein
MPVIPALRRSEAQRSAWARYLKKPKPNQTKNKNSWALVAHAYIILATQEAEIGRIMVQSQPKQIVLKTLSRKKLFTKKSAGV